MKIKTAFFSMAVIAIFSLIVISATSGTEGNKRIALAYSNNIEGYLEPCG